MNNTSNLLSDSFERKKNVNRFHFKIVDEDDIFQNVDEVESKIPKPIRDKFEAMIQDDFGKAQLIEDIVSRHHSNVVKTKIPTLLITLQNIVSHIQKYIPGSKHPLPAHILENVEIEKRKLADSIIEFIHSRTFEIEALTVILDTFPKAHTETIRLIEEESYISEIVVKQICQTGKTGDRIIQSALDVYFSNVIQKYTIAFDALKKQFKADINLAAKSSQKSISEIPPPLISVKVIEPIIQTTIEVPKNREALKKLERISARIETVLFDPKKIQEGELENHMKHTESTDTDCPETKKLRDSIRSKIFAINTLMCTNTSPFVFDTDSPSLEAISEPVTRVENSPEQTLILEEIRRLKLHIGNPSSTRITNMNSFGDGHFWFNILNPFLNFLSEHIIRNPDDARLFDWWNIAQVYSMTFVNEPKLRAWCGTLALENSDSGDFLTEWAKLPRFVRAQQNQGEFKKKF